jgi:ketosteroid isomerase-like protein
MDHARLQEWIDTYERVWRTPGVDLLAELFADDVTYLPSPWAEPIRGLASLAAFWKAQRDGPDETFTMTAEVVAVDGDVGVARIDVGYGSGDRWRDLWIIRLGADGRCAMFEEWPIAPEQPDGHG